MPRERLRTGSSARARHAGRLEQLGDPRLRVRRRRRGARRRRGSRGPRGRGRAAGRAPSNPIRGRTRVRLARAARWPSTRTVPVVRHEQRREHPQQRRLAGAVRAEARRASAPVASAKLTSAQRLALAEAAHEPVERDRVGRRSLPACRSSGAGRGRRAQLAMVVLAPARRSGARARAAAPARSPRRPARMLFGLPGKLTISVPPADAGDGAREHPVRRVRRATPRASPPRCPAPRGRSRRGSPRA